MYIRAYRAKALAGEHAGDLKHEEERRKKRGLNKPCTFPLQGSLWFVFRALGNHGMDDSSGNQSSLESIDIPSKQRHCRLHFWQRKYYSHRQDAVSILIQVRETFHEILEFLHHRYFKLCIQTFNQKKGVTICSLMPVESLKQVTNIVSVQNSYNTSTAEITELKKKLVWISVLTFKCMNVAPTIITYFDL